ncbi:hypothetical protein [Tritonibacter mobilis]|uniref:hypothetical protein n=1 Tax=Tritonibacter mobilis TaxID=379347 RepID=UPI001D0D6EF4|nr:hypothetical protein [Tritonibacter mobilis]
MSIPSFSAFPEIPQRSTPEADFDAKMYALFQHFATTHRQELLAFIQFLENNVTAIEGAINGVTIGLTHPAAAKFTSLTADSISGAAVQASVADITAGRLVKVGAFGLGTRINENVDVSANRGNGFYYAFSDAANRYRGGNHYLIDQTYSVDYRAQIAVPSSSAIGMGLRRKIGGDWEGWGDVVVLDENGITPQNIEIRNSGPFFAITDADTGVKHILSGNSTAGHLYLKTDSAENMPNWRAGRGQRGPCFRDQLYRPMGGPQDGSLSRYRRRLDGLLWRDQGRAPRRQLQQS